MHCDGSFPWSKGCFSLFVWWTRVRRLLPRHWNQWVPTRSCHPQNISFHGHVGKNTLMKEPRDTLATGGQLPNLGSRSGSASVGAQCVCRLLQGWLHPQWREKSFSVQASIALGELWGLTQYLMLTRPCDGAGTFSVLIDKLRTHLPWQRDNGTTDKSWWARAGAAGASILADDAFPPHSPTSLPLTGFPRIRSFFILCLPMVLSSPCCWTCFILPFSLVTNLHICFPQWVAVHYRAGLHCPALGALLYS